MRKSELAVGPERVEPVEPRARTRIAEAASASGTSVAHRTISTASKGKENSAEGAQRAAASTDTVYSRER